MYIYIWEVSLPLRSLSLLLYVKSVTGGKGKAICTCRPCCVHSSFDPLLSLSVIVRACVCFEGTSALNGVSSSFKLYKLGRGIRLSEGKSKYTLTTALITIKTTQTIPFSWWQSREVWKLVKIQGRKAQAAPNIKSWSSSCSSPQLLDSLPCNLRHIDSAQALEQLGSLPCSRNSFTGSDVFSRWGRVHRWGLDYMHS